MTTKILTFLLLASLLAAGIYVATELLSSDSTDPAAAANEEPNLDALKSLPYATWVTIPEEQAKKEGVTVYDERGAAAGLNLFAARDKAEAHLMDMAGNLLHTWKLDARKFHGEWHHVELCKNGDLLVVVRNRALVRVDWDSRVKWVLPRPVHHDVAESDNGDVHVLTRHDRLETPGQREIAILTDVVTQISEDGKVTGTMDLYTSFRDFIPSDTLDSLHVWTQELDLARALRKREGQGPFVVLVNVHSPGDLLHANTVELLNTSIEGVGKYGDMLVSLKHLNMIAIIDRHSGKVLWNWGSGELRKPHHPRLLENGHILVFDNGDDERPFSRVLELDPITQQIVWEFRGSPEEDLYTEWGGSAQRFANGNTMIVDTDSGRAFEVNRTGEIVWEYLTPVGPDKVGLTKTRVGLYRVFRITDPSRYAHLQDIWPYEFPASM